MTIYTNEELAAMTQDQLLGIVLQSQATYADIQTVADPAGETVEEAVNTKVVAQTDTEKAIEQVKVAIANLEIIGSEVFQSEIEGLKIKLANLEAKVIEEAQKIETELQTEVATVKTELVTFYEKYRTDINIIAVLIVLHIAGVFGL